MAKSFINDERSETVEQTRIWWGYNALCGYPIRQQSHLLFPRTSYVRSYRGPKMFEESCDGTSKMERFNDFRRVHIDYLFKPAYYCNGLNYTAYWDDLIILLLHTSPSIIWGDIPPFLEEDFVDIIQEEILDYIQRDLYRKANAPRFNGTVAAVELLETLKDIKKLFSGCLKLFTGAKDFADLILHYGLNSEELYLWVRYALIPTMKDVEDLIKALDSKWKPISRVKAGRKTRVHRRGLVKTGYWWSQFELNFDWTLKAKCSGGGAMDVCASKQWNDWGDLPWDSVLALWEAIPFSFIADWFIQFGAWLESLRPSEVSIAQQYSTGAIEGSISFKPSSAGLVTPDGAPKIDFFIMLRDIDFEAPKFPLETDAWKEVIHVVDAINLVVSLLKGKLKR